MVNWHGPQQCFGKSDSEMCCNAMLQLTEIEWECISFFLSNNFMELFQCTLLTFLLFSPLDSLFTSSERKFRNIKWILHLFNGLKMSQTDIFSWFSFVQQTRHRNQVNYKEKGNKVLWECLELKSSWNSFIHSFSGFQIMENCKQISLSSVRNTAIWSLKHSEIRIKITSCVACRVCLWRDTMSKMSQYHKLKFCW